MIIRVNLTQNIFLRHKYRFSFRQCGGNVDLILNAEKTNRHIKVAKAQKRDSVVRTWTLYWADQSHILILQLKNSHRRWRKMTRRQQKRYVQV